MAIENLARRFEIQSPKSPAVQILHHASRNTLAQIRHERDRTHKKNHRARIAEPVTDLKGEKAVFYPLGAI